MHTLYIITYLPTDTVVYVGETNNFKRRVSEHKCKAYARGGRSISQAIQANGKSNYKFTVFAKGPEMLMKELEAALIKFYDTAGPNGYNVMTTPHNGWQGIGGPGEKNGRSKLTNAQVLDIRKQVAEKTATAKQMAVQYGVTYHTIYGIVNRISWKHI